MPIHIKFEQTPELQYDFIKHYYTTNRTIRIAAYVLVGVVLISVIPMLTGNREGADMLSVVFPIIFILAIGLWLIPFFLKRRLRSAAGKGGMNNEREMILAEDEITVKTNVSDSSFSWDGITKVSASKTSYFLFIAANQALMAPKDAFATEADHDAFLELLMEKGLWP